MGVHARTGARRRPRAVLAGAALALVATTVIVGVGNAAPPATPAAASGDTTVPALVAGTPCTTTAKACVDLGRRVAWLIDNGAVTRGPVGVAAGDDQTPTPLGTFTVQWKAEQYTSREYLTQMPYSVFFADGGIAFHEGRQDTYSGGCVKLVHDDAVAWFSYLQVGDQVQVH